MGKRRHQAVLWLEDYLINWKKMVIIVSHARDFLDAVVTDIVHMQNKKLTRYKVHEDTTPHCHGRVGPTPSLPLTHALGAFATCCAGLIGRLQQL